MADRFVSDIQQVCSRIRARLVDQPTAGGSDEAAVVIALLYDVLETERVCIRRYSHEHSLAQALHGDDAARGFLAYVAEEKRHAALVSGRIAQLEGRRPDESAAATADGPTGAESSPAGDGPQKDDKADALEDLVRDDLTAERAIYHAYADIARWLESHDAVSAEVMREILEGEVTHVDP